MTMKPDRGRVTIREHLCKGCGLCVEACPPKVIRLGGGLNRLGYHAAEYLGSGCTGCGICFYRCPEPGTLTVYRRVQAAVAPCPAN
ncbi:MAG: 4Fe-4S dicluster domain-containing protein [Acidobacteria bacterium]|nr:4Fe-4S dicluster domain-containing protein [Acidobacteriota bacterium]